MRSCELATSGHDRAMPDDLIYSIVTEAEAYPYDLREEAFVFRDGLPHPFQADLTTGRTPVLAIGSNGAPRRLARKFGEDAVVPVLPARLKDHAVVYAAAITSYGSVPATLVEAPGATALVALTFLDDRQLEVMNVTEHVGRNYDVMRLPGAVEVDDAPFGGEVTAYRSRFGPLRVDGQPVRLAEVPTVGTRFGAAYQSGMLALLHHHFAQPGEIYAAFVGDLVASSARREEIMGELARGVATRRPGVTPQKPV
jgi:hypothetical protein